MEIMKRVSLICSLIVRFELISLFCIYFDFSCARFLSKFYSAALCDVEDFIFMRSNGSMMLPHFFAITR